jgi:hypothetical protein
MPRKIIRPSNGHILDIDPSEIADQFLTLAHNVNTRKGFPSRIGGRRIAYPDVTNDPLHLLNLQLNTFNWWMTFSTNNIHAVEGTNEYDITPIGMDTVADTSEWCSDLLNGIPVFTNGKDDAMFWDGNSGSDAASLPDWPAGTICRAIVAFKFHIFALNIDGPGGTFDNMLMWSDAAAPGALPASWTPGAGNEAGSAFCADTPGRIICGKSLNSQLLLYKPTSIYAAEYVGQQPDNIFVIRPVIRSLGILSPHCVADLGTKHLIVGNDDVVLFDGVNMQSIAENRIKQFLRNSIDETYAANTFVIRDLNNHETWICVPESGSQFATVAHIWDERRDTWITRDLNAVRYGTTGLVADTTVDDTWDSDSDPWDTDITVWNQPSDGSITNVVVAEDTQLFLENSSDVTTIQAQLSKYDLFFDDDTQSKLIERLWIRGTGLGFADVEFRLGSRNSTDDNIVWQSWDTMEADGRSVEISGRYISLEIRVNSTLLWTINRFVFDWKYNGAF